MGLRYSGPRMWKGVGEEEERAGSDAVGPTTEDSNTVLLFVEDLCRGLM